LMCFLDDIFCYGLLAIARAFGTALPVTLYLAPAMMQRGRVQVIAPHKRQVKEDDKRKLL